MKRLLFLLGALLFVAAAHAQFSRYIVKFKNKGSNPYQLSNPSAFLSQKAIARRTHYGITIDSTDLPVTPKYIDSLLAVPNVTVLNISKWINQVSIQTTNAAALAKINSFDFVQSVAPIAARKSPGSTNEETLRFREMEEEIPAKAAGYTNTQANFFNYGANSFAEIHLHNGEFLHNLGMRGDNMTIAMLDGGFINYNVIDGLDSLNKQGRVLGTWDFVRKNANVSVSISHGLQCLSTIAGNIPGSFIGKAPMANFYLFITEDAGSEYPIEEHNWVCGAERADSAGADVISCSLGYSTFDNASFNHTYADLNGDKTIGATGADLAAKKGMLVFNSAGNEGNNAWHYIMTPADADSIVAVGAVDANGNVGSFSSYGPSADGRVKPDVASVGVSALVLTSGNTISRNNGTSFAGPNMAGLGTCLWQAFPEVNNMKIIYTLRQAGSIAANPNDRIGYGIPDMKKATMLLLKELATASATVDHCKPSVQWSSKDVEAMRYELERKQPNDTGFIKIKNINGSGSVFAKHDYTFSDSSNSNAGITLYRIRQVVDTAASNFAAVYLDTVAVNIPQTCALTHSFNILPNPAREKITIVLTDAKAVEHLGVLITNMEGQVLSRIIKNKPAGYYSTDLPVQYLAAGKYVVTLYDGQTLMTTKQFIKY